MGKLIARILGGVVLVAALAVAGMDFMAKSKFEGSKQAVFDKLDQGDGFTVDELSGAIQGEPTVIGDPNKDAEVTYRWGLIRDYDLKLVIQGTESTRYVVQVLE